MRIDIDDKTFDMLCGMSGESLKDFFDVLRRGAVSAKEDLSFKDLKRKIPKASRQLLEPEEKKAKKSE